MKAVRRKLLLRVASERAIATMPSFPVYTSDQVSTPAHNRRSTLLCPCRLPTQACCQWTARQAKRSRSCARIQATASPVAEEQQKSGEYLGTSLGNVSSRTAVCQSNARCTSHRLCICTQGMHSISPHTSRLTRCRLRKPLYGPSTGTPCH